MWQSLGGKGLRNKSTHKVILVAIISRTKDLYAVDYGLELGCTHVPRAGLSEPGGAGGP